jgi:hypothetical protein
VKGKKMALTKCKECGASVSEKAESCPSCGNPIKSKKKPLVSKPAGCVLQLASLPLLLFGFTILMDDTGDKAIGILLLIIGAVLLLVGGRTKARL